MLNVHRNTPWSAKKIVKTASTLKWDLSLKKQETKLTKKSLSYLYF